MIPGEFIIKEGTIEYNKGKEAIKLYEVNDYLKFDREKAYGKRLDIPSGTAVRFEPGDKKEINLIDIGGVRRVYGLRNLVDGYLDGRRVKE